MNLSEKNKRAKKIMALDKYTNAYDAFDIEPDRLTKELEANKKAQDEDLTSGQKSLVWENEKSESYKINEIQNEKRQKNILPYIKKSLENINGIIPNDIYIDNDIIVPFKNGCDITTTREQIISRLQNTWLKNYLKSAKQGQGFLSISFKNNINDADEDLTPGQQHLDFSKVESLNRKARAVLAMNEISDELARKSMRMRGQNMALAQSDERKASGIVSYAEYKKDKEFIDAAKKNYDKAFNDRVEAEKKYDRNAKLNISRDRRREMAK